jgi:hypothetical protein
VERRAISQVRRTANRVTAVGDPGKPWAPRAVADVVRDILEVDITYYVPWPEGDVDLRVIDAQNGAPSLWCDRDERAAARRNALLDLPDC